MKTFIITPAAGKRLIGKAIASNPVVIKAATEGTLVIIAGTTNAYVAQEVLAKMSLCENFSPDGFYRGTTLPPGGAVSGKKKAAEFPGDVVISAGMWQKGKSIFDVVASLREGDVILKGANALDLVRRQAAVMVGHPQGGTIHAAMAAVAGRRVRLILPVGVEKRIPEDLLDLAARTNVPGKDGPRLYPVPGEVFTELDAIRLLTGAEAELIGAGGVGGAEGAVWIAVSGTEQEVQSAATLLTDLGKEPLFDI